jgi:hypothetical protein
LYFAHCRYRLLSVICTPLLNASFGGYCRCFSSRQSEIQKFVDSRVLSYQHVSVLVCQTLVLFGFAYAETG